MSASRPDRQRVLLVAVPARDDWTPQEAVQLTFGTRDCIESQRLIDETRRLVMGTPHTYEERQHQQHWGATGMFQQEVIIAYAAGVLSGATVEGIKAALMALMHCEEGERIKAPTVWNVGNDMESAWKALDECLRTAFDTQKAVALSGRREAMRWVFDAADGNARFHGVVTDELRVVEVRRLVGT